MINKTTIVTLFCSSSTVLKTYVSKPLAIIGFCISCILLSQPSLANTLPELTIGDRERRVTQEWLEIIQKYHYQPKPIDDTFATEAFNNYLTNIDSQGTYLTQEDLVPFQHLATSLDEALLAGDLSDMVAMYDVMQKQRYAMFSYFIDWLEQAYNEFDFTADETLFIYAEDRPRPNDQIALQHLWRKLLKNQFINGFINAETDTQIRTRLIKRYKNQLNRLTQVTNQDMYNTIANSITSIVGPHTNYLSPRDVEDFTIDMSLSLEGIGAVLQTDNDYTKVTRIIVGGPADKAGELKVTDYIVGVSQADEDMVDIIGWRLDEVVNLIRGAKGTKVRLEIIPEGDLKNAPQVIEIIRDKVKLEDQSATKEIIDVATELGKVKIGVIKIPTFYIDFEALRKGEKDYKSTTRDVHTLLKELQEEDIHGLIIDLRNNGGGSLQEAKQLTSLFIMHGPIVQVGYNNGRLENHIDRSNFMSYQGPMAVLVNRASASASEIFAGAIQDYHRGLIIGSQTYGKGTVQSLVDISHGQIKLTQSKFYRVTGESTQHRGVIPDIELPSTIDPKKHGESTLEYALPWDRVASQQHANYFTLSNIIPQLQENTAARIEQSPDMIYVQKVKQRRSNEPRSISLKLSERQERWQENEAWYLNAINTMRQAKGMDAIEDLDDHEFDYEEAIEDPYLQMSSSAITDWLILAQ